MAKEESLLRTSSGCCGSDWKRLKDAQVGKVRPPNGNRDCVRHIHRYTYTGIGMDVRKMLQKQIGIIPDSVKTGSVQNVIQWKEKAERATKLLKNPRASVREMQDALEQLQRISK